MNFTLHNDQNIYVKIKKYHLGQGPEYKDGPVDSDWKNTIKKRNMIYNTLRPYIENGEKLKVLNIEPANRQNRGFNELQLTKVCCEISGENLYDLVNFYVGTADDDGWEDRYEVEFSIE